MSKQDNIYNLAGQYNSRLHISNFIEPLIEPLKKKYGVKVDELSILWDQVFEDQYKDQVYPKKITTEYRFINGAKKIYRRFSFISNRLGYCWFKIKIASFDTSSFRSSSKTK